MRTIYKYKLSLSSVIEMPVGAKILTVQEQFGDPVMWALVDPHARTEPRSFRVIGTGHDASDVDSSKYIGTFQLNNGNIVFHLFEI